MMVLDTNFAELLNSSGDAFEYLMDLDGTVLREMDGRRTVRFSLAEKTYYLKAHSGVGWAEILKNMLQLRWAVTGAENEWQGIQRLQELGIDTMTLVGYGSRGVNPATRRSFVVTEGLENTLNLEDFCADWGKQEPISTQQRVLKRVLIRKVAEIARGLHVNGVNHRDFYLCHFLLDKTDELPRQVADSIKLYLIDLHRMQCRASTPERWARKDIAALYFSSMDIGLTRHDLFRFIVTYSGCPLRVALGKRGKFWNRVRSRARGLYCSFHGREPLARY